MGGLEGRSLVFTIGDGTQIQKAAIEALRRFVVGRTLEEFQAEPGLFAQALAERHQLRWLALGTYRMAVGGVVNALWDLWAKSEGVPMWRLLTGLPPEKIVQWRGFPPFAGCVDGGGVAGDAAVAGGGAGGESGAVGAGGDSGL
jgi:L-fuconate dehydratase